MTTGTMESTQEETSASLTSTPDIVQLVTFRLGDEEYGVPITYVQEVILIGQVTEIPQVPGDLRGLINLRGHVIPIVDLRVRFALAVTELTEHSRIVILNVDSRITGVVVDGVDEVLRIDRSKISATPTGFAGVNHKYIQGLVKLENRLLILLNCEEMVAVT